MHKWKPDVWHGTSDPQILKRFDTYSLKFKHGKIWLRVMRPKYLQSVKYEYTADFGHDSEYSFSGCLEAIHNDLTLEEAQDTVLQKVKFMNGWI